MRVAHVHEAPLSHPGRAPLRVGEDKRADEDTLANIQFLPVVVDLGILHGEPRTVTCTEPEVQPIRDIDQVFVHDLSSGNLGDQPVVEPRHIGAWVVHVAGRGFGRGAARCEVAVAEGAQRLSKWFF